MTSSWFATSAQNGPFLVMWYQSLQGTCLIVLGRINSIIMSLGQTSYQNFSARLYAKQIRWPPPFKCRRDAATTAAVVARSDRPIDRLLNDTSRERGTVRKLRWVAQLCLMSRTQRGKIFQSPFFGIRRVPWMRCGRILWEALPHFIRLFLQDHHSE